jgi:hypothetical protein
MNNLPHLESLPIHLSSWGKGNLSRAKGSEEATDSVVKKGDGLEVLDLGNCSLADTSLSLFIAAGQSISTSATKSKGKSTTNVPRWPHLRSLSLHSNPLTITTPDYATQLQSSSDLPSLQIIDARRVVERKRKGEEVQSRADRKALERRKKRAKPSGANTGTVTKMRTWGNAESQEVGDPHTLKQPAQAEALGVTDGLKEKKRKRHHEDVPVDPAILPINKTKKSKSGTVADGTGVTQPIVNDKSERPPKREQNGQASQPITTDPSSLAAPTKHKPTKSETAVVQVIDVAKDNAGKKSKKDKTRKGEESGSHGIVDLKAVFGKKEDSEGTGLGVGGW